MRVYKKKILWTVILFGLLSTSFEYSTYTKGRSPRLQPDYDVLFQNSAGTEVNLSNLKGKVLVINYWAKWCLPCLAEMPALNQLYLDLKDENIIFMAVDVEGDAMKGSRFMEKRKFSIPVYHIKSKLPADLITKSIPTTIILDKKGSLVNKHIGSMNFKSIKFKEALRQLSKE